MEKDGREFPVGNATTDAGKQGLELLRQIVGAAPAWRKGLSTDVADATKAARATNVFTCPGCGAELRPADDTEKCVHCGAVVAVPDVLRTRIHEVRQARAAQSHVGALVDRLLSLPSARSTNVFIFAASILMLGAIPAATFNIASETADALLVAAIGIGISLDATIAAWMHVVDRKALRVLLTAFAASSPRREGEPERCRRCDAPLPEVGGDDAIVRCVYCSADNVLGLDVGIRSTVVRDEADLGAALAFRGRMRRAGFIALLVTTVTSVALVVVAMRRPG